MSDEKQVSYLQKNREHKYLRLFLKNKMIPVVVGRPDAMTEEYHRTWLTHLRFKVLQSDNGMFYCQFPKGWTKKIMPNSTVWCYLYDDRKRKRAAIFFKFLQKRGKKVDFSSHINYMCRYRPKVYVDPKDKFKVIGECIDSETMLLKEFEPMIIVSDTQLDENNYRIVLPNYINAMYSKCSNWLKEYYPEFENISAYWEDD